MKPDIIYLDNAATTKLDPRALSVMLPWLKMSYGNPSSLHALGLEAYRALEAAREQCGRLLDAPSERIVFTSSGTEANNLIIKGLRPRLEGRRVLATRLEHASVLEPLAFLASRGIEVTWIDNRRPGDTWIRSIWTPCWPRRTAGFAASFTVPTKWAPSRTWPGWRNASGRKAPPPGSTWTASNPWAMCPWRPSPLKSTPSPFQDTSSTVPGAPPWSRSSARTTFEVWNRSTVAAARSTV